MSRGAIRAAVALFVIGVLAVWLIAPIGDACPDAALLPADSTHGSAPSFAPPLTRTCTYTTAQGTQARTRYVPLLDWVVLAALAGIAGTAITLMGPGRGPPRSPGPASRPRPDRSRAARPPRAGEPPPAAGERSRREREAAERAHARAERERRRT